MTVNSLDTPARNSYLGNRRAENDLHFSIVLGLFLIDFSILGR